MAKKNKKSAVAEKERLSEVYITRLKVQVLQGNIEAFQQRQRALAIELEVIPKKLADAEAQRADLLASYQAAYQQLKDDMELEEGQEVNLETGEVVSPTS